MVAQQLTPSERELLQQEQTCLQADIRILSDEISELRHDLIHETRREEQNRLESVIKKKENLRTEFQNKLSHVERQIAANRVGGTDVAGTPVEPVGDQLESKLNVRQSNTQQRGRFGKSGIIIFAGLGVLLILLVILLERQIFNSSTPSTPSTASSTMEIVLKGTAPLKTAPIFIMTVLIRPFNCANGSNLTDNFKAALNSLLGDSNIVATVKLDYSATAEVNTNTITSNERRIVISAQCQGDRITYHLALPVEDGSANQIAEPEFLSLTWNQDSVNVPAQIAAAAVAYHTANAQQAAIWLTEVSVNWEQIPPSERAYLKFLQGNAWLQHPDPSASESAMDVYGAALKDIDSDRGSHVALAARLHNNRGRVYLNQGTKEEDEKLLAQAETEFTLAIEADQNYVWAWLGRSEVRMRTKHYPESRADCTQTTRLKTDFAPGYTCRAIAYIDEGLFYSSDSNSAQKAQEAFAQALADAHRGIEADAHYAPAYLFAGVSTCRLGDLQAGMALIQQAQEIWTEPSFIDAANYWRINYCKYY